MNGLEKQGLLGVIVASQCLMTIIVIDHQPGDILQGIGILICMGLLVFSMIMFLEGDNLFK